MYFRNLIIFRFPTVKAMFAACRAGLLEENRLKPVGAFELESCGFIPPLGRGSSQLVHPVGNFYWLSIGGEQKILPGAAVAELLEKKIAELEAREGRKPGGRARKRLKEDLIHELLPRALVKPYRIDVMLDMFRNICVINTSSRRAAENAVSQIRHGMGSFPALPLNAEVAPRSVLTGWIAGEPLPDGLVLGDECELRDPSDRGAVVKIQRLDLQADEVQGHLASGKQVTRLALTLDDHVSFVLGEDLIIRRFKLLDGAIDRLETDDADDLHAELDARFALMAGETGRLFDVLEKALHITPAE